MLIRSCLAMLVGLSLCGIAAISAHAQQDEERDVVYEAGRNKVGLLRYCRNNTLLDRDSADSAASAVEAGLASFVPDEPASREKGDKAEKAGEAGFWEASGKRDLASLASLFGTTPAGLCQEWAKETLRNQQVGTVRQDIPVYLPETTSAPEPVPAVKAAKVRPPFRPKVPLFPKVASPARQAPRKAAALPVVAPPVLPERGPRAEAVTRREAASPPPVENRWDSAKVYIPIPFVRMIVRPAAREKPVKPPAPGASADPLPQQEDGRPYRRALPWQIPSRCTIQGGPPQLSAMCGKT
jgi:hypothetical protein